MAGIYIHIPYCRKACHYCDFHFSTNLSNKSELLVALKKEITLRKGYLKEAVETIYFGGGTPSVLVKNELSDILQEVFSSYDIITAPEITLEANPDDLTDEYLADLRAIGITRLSIGVQSFVEKDLRFMNRSHDSEQAITCISKARSFGFDNFSVDLMFGLPGTDAKWLQHNLEIIFSLNVPHISVYGLTIEERTALASQVKKGEVSPLDDQSFNEQFRLLMDAMEAKGYIQYEISNFAKQGHFSRHNSSYWHSRPYLGFGPGAHSFNGVDQRHWNIRSNAAYIKGIAEGISFAESEELGVNERVNEILMTGLRTIWGADLRKIEEIAGKEISSHILIEAGKYLQDGKLVLKENKLFLTKEGKLISDQVSSDLFLV